MLLHRWVKWFIQKLLKQAGLMMIVVLLGVLIPGRTEAAVVSEAEAGSGTAYSPAFSTEPCQLPTAGTAISTANLGTPFVDLGSDPAFEGSPQLVIECLRMDRSHYPADATWIAEVVVTNRGDGESGPFGVTGLTCRYKANSASSFDCNNSVWSLGLHDGLAPGESVLLQSVPHLFTLPLDPPGQYPSWVPGLPDNGIVYLRAQVDTMPAGQYVVTEAVYPTAPPGSLDPGLVDEDQDGWSPDGNPDDCDDNNPDIHPGAVEINGDVYDNDCDGGDTPLGGPCPELYYGFIHGATDICALPGSNTFPDILDLDGDGVTVAEGDCDDYNAFINPFAPELNDSIDNNCNGLVDETYAIPDWIIENYIVERVMGEYTLANGTTILVPGLSYEVEIGNIGDYIGEDFSILQAVQHDILFYGAPIATGTAGFIPFTQMPSSHLYGCTEQQLGATIAQTGLYGEVNFTNNFAEFWIPPVYTDFLSLHFEETPELPVDGGSDTLIIDSNAGLSGSCPDLPTTLNGGTDYVQIHRLLIGHDQVLYNDTSLGVSYSPPVSLPEEISPGDHLCLQVVLDPNHLIVDDPDDNMYAVIFEYKDPLFGPPRFDVVEQVLGPPAGVDFNTDGCNVSVDGALIGSSPGPSIPYIAIVLVGVGGGVLGGVGGWITGAGNRLRTVVILIGLLAGGVVGGTLPTARESGNNGAEAIALDTIGGTSDGLPVCEDLAQMGDTWPINGSTINPRDPTPLTWEASFSEGQLVPDQVTFKLTSPDGEEVLLVGHRVPTEGGVLRYETALSLGEELYLAGVNLLDLPGEHEWLVVIASVFPEGGDLAVPVCAGSESFAFQVGNQPRSTPTVTPTDTGIQVTPASATPTSRPPTRTPKPTSPPPTRTPIPKNSPTPTIYIP